jgi:hypothetical protein
MSGSEGCRVGRKDVREIVRGLRGRVDHVAISCCDCYIPWQVLHSRLIGHCWIILPQNSWTIGMIWVQGLWLIDSRRITEFPPVI